MRKHTGLWGKLYLALILLLLYLPILVVAVYSFNASKSSAAWGGFTLDWYRSLLSSGKYIGPLGNSLLTAGLSVGGAAVIGTLAAVGAASRAFKTKGIFESVAMIPIMIPEIILGLALLSVFALAKIPMGMTAITLGHVTFCIPYIYLVVRGRLRGIDKSVLEAARDLGASPLRTFFTVTVPLLAPAIGGGCLLAFAMSFDDVIISFFLSAPGSDMLPVKIYSSLKLGLTPEINALFTLMLLALFILLLAGLAAAAIYRKAACGVYLRTPHGFPDEEG
ncbi:MAG: ABC transporter permease [Clostridiales bacterium]|nr:ABC transporter permease [Clostridiales bacterium]